MGVLMHSVSRMYRFPKLMHTNSIQNDHFGYFDKVDVRLLNSTAIPHESIPYDVDYHLAIRFIKAKNESTDYKMTKSTVNKEASI